MTDSTTEPRRLAAADWKWIGLFVVVSLVARLACINLNAAEYTDGILQITAFEYGFTFWPPLYTVLVKGVATVAGDLELAGKLISILSSSLVILPVYWAALFLVGRRAAVWATLLYLANAIAGRWGIRVMSDALFSLLFFAPAAILIVLIGSDKSADESKGDVRLFWVAAVLAPLSALTRYQGIFLLPLEIIAMIVLSSRREQTGAGTPTTSFVIAGLLWLAPIVWLVTHFGGHGQQIGQRAGASPLLALLNYWNLAEAFALLFPYFVTIPVYVLSVVGFGLFAFGDRSQRTFAWCFFIFAGIVIAMQSVFSSFQSRYLLPLIPFMMVFVGVAATRWEERVAQRRTVIRAALIACLLYSLAWTAAVLVLQRGAFGDIKEAAQFCSRLPDDARIFSTESYKPQMPSVKMSYWAGREIAGFGVYTQDTPFRAGDRVIRPGDAITNSGELLSLQPGDYVCLHSGYGGLNLAPLLAEHLRFGRFGRQIEMLSRHYELEEVGVFGSELIALLPDIMENPDSHQNPAAWFFRYQPQRFRSTVFRIKSVRSQP